jgi:hypothetical protein
MSRNEPAGPSLEVIGDNVDDGSEDDDDDVIVLGFGAV